MSVLVAVMSRRQVIGMVAVISAVGESAVTAETLARVERPGTGALPPGIKAPADEVIGEEMKTATAGVILVDTESVVVGVTFAGTGEVVVTAVDARHSQATRGRPRSPTASRGIFLG